jgi:hypothetical protein
LHTVGCVELEQDALHVILHRKDADAEDGCDLFIGLAVIDPAQHLGLATRQAFAYDALVATRIRVDANRTDGVRVKVRRQ